MASRQTDPRRGAVASSGSFLTPRSYRPHSLASAAVTGCSPVACHGSLTIADSSDLTGRMASIKPSRTRDARLGGRRCRLEVTHRPRASQACGRKARFGAMGTTLHQTLARESGTEANRGAGCSRSRDSARWSDYASYNVAYFSLRHLNHS